MQMRLKVQKISWFLSWKGLLGQKPQPIVFKTRFGIHTFGMTYPIDIVILDNKGVVRKIKQNLKPNTLFFWNPLFKTVLELPKNTIALKGVKVGEKVNLVFEAYQ